MKNKYRIHLYSRDWDYAPFDEVPDKPVMERHRVENGEIITRPCAGAEYDTQVETDVRGPVGAISSKEPFYFLKTMAMLRLVEGKT